MVVKMAIDFSKLPITGVYTTTYLKAQMDGGNYDFAYQYSWAGSNTIELNKLVASDLLDFHHLVKESNKNHN